jgi:hypothetical protein
MIEPRFEHVMPYTAQLADPEVIGAVPDDLKINFYVTGGTVTGPRVSGKLRPVGGDWLTLRKDGIAVLDVRAPIETNDGALIYVTYPGIIDFGPNGYENFVQGRSPGSAVGDSDFTTFSDISLKLCLAERAALHRSRPSIS